MEDCCEVPEKKNRSRRQGQILLAAFAINLAMFLVEATFGLVADSTSLMADAVDMFADSVVYILSFLALHRTIQAKARVAMFNGGLETLLGLAVLAEAISKIFRDVTPHHETMSVIAVIALVANLVCALLLLKYRDDDINMKAVWICSRNDALGNLATLGAAGLVALTATKWPDVIVGGSMAIFIIWSAIGVFREARRAH